MSTSKTERVVKGWGTPEVFTFPFTPTIDGYVVGFVAPSTSSASYLYINEDTTPWFRGCSTGGTSFGISFPARAGKEYKIANSSNIGSNSTYRFVPFK